MKIKSIKKLNYREDTGTVSIDTEHKIHSHHNFLTSAGVFIMNSADGKGTQIDVLQGSANDLGELPDLDYFYDKLYKALNVPQLRRDKETRFEAITINNISVEREEIKFFKFIVQLRKRFNLLFLDLLKKDLLAKKVFSLTDWKEIKNEIKFVYKNNSNYSEKSKLMNLEERMNIAQSALSMIEEGIVTKHWIKKEILNFSDEDLKEFDKDIEREMKREEELKKKFPDATEDDNAGF